MTNFLLLILLLVALWYYSNYKQQENFEHLDVEHSNLLQSSNVVPQQQDLPQQVAPDENKYKQKYMHQLGSCHSTGMQHLTPPSDVQSLMMHDLSMAATVKQNRDNVANFTKVTSQSSDTLPNSVDKLAELRTTTNPEDSLRTCGRKISDVYNNLVSPQILSTGNEQVSGFDSLNADFMAL